LVDYLAVSWFDLGGGDYVTRGFGVLGWYGLPLLGTYWATAAMLSTPATRTPPRLASRDARLALPLAVVSLVGWLAFYWFGTNQGVTLN
jgi:hypothetical protein